MGVIKQVKKRNLTTQGFDYTDIGAEAQYVDVSYDANGNIIEDITEPGVVVSSTKSVAEALNDIGPGGGTPEFVGTMAEWIALTPQQKSQYTIVNILDDSETGETVDAVTDGDMRAVTSNAVYDTVSSIEADNIVEISQADYDELTEEEKHNGKAYFIYDAPGGGGASALDDLTDVEISLATDGQVLKYDGTNEVWVNDDEESEIDDTSTSNDSTWSSNKINTQDQIPLEMITKNVENGTASEHSYSVPWRTFLRKNNQLYRIMDTINAGDTLTENVNIANVTLDSMLTIVPFMVSYNGAENTFNDFLLGLINNMLTYKCNIGLPRTIYSSWTGHGDYIGIGMALSYRVSLMLYATGGGQLYSIVYSPATTTLNVKTLTFS